MQWFDLRGIPWLTSIQLVCMGGAKYGGIEEWKGGGWKGRWGYPSDSGWNTGLRLRAISRNTVA